MLGAFISIFQINSKRHRAEALKPAANGRYLMCKSLSYYLHLLYISSLFVSFCNYMNGIFKVQVDEPLPKRGGRKPEYPEINSDSQPESTRYLR